MSDYDLAAIGAYLDTERPGWRTEPEADVLTWGNTPAVKRRRSHRIFEPTIYALFGPQRGEEVLQAMEAAAAQDAIAARVLGWLRTVGVDVGDDSAPALLAGWVSAGIITQAEADVIDALGSELVSPFESQGWRIVCPTVIAAAREV